MKMSKSIKYPLKSVKGNFEQEILNEPIKIPRTIQIAINENLDLNIFFIFLIHKS